MRQKFSMAKRLAAAAAAVVVLGAPPPWAATSSSPTGRRSATPCKKETLSGALPRGFSAIHGAGPTSGGSTGRDPESAPDLSGGRDRTGSQRPDGRRRDGAATAPRRPRHGAAAALDPVEPARQRRDPEHPAGRHRAVHHPAAHHRPRRLAQAAEIISGKDQRVVAGRRTWSMSPASSRVPATSGTCTARASSSCRCRPRRCSATSSASSARPVERFGPVSSVRIASSNEEILVGDRLLPAPREPVIAYVPHPPAQPVNGQIIAAATELVELGRGSVVTLDKGARDGLDVGSVLAIYHVVRRSRIRGPRRSPTS